MKTAEDNGEFSYTPIKSKDMDDDDDENFDDANEIPTQSMTSTTASSTSNKLLSPVNSDRSMNNSKQIKLSSFSRETSGTSKASSIISTTATAGSGRRASLTDVEKELQDFDIDLNKDDVSDTENGPLVSKGTFKKSTDENEVKRFSRSLTTHFGNILTR